MRKRVWLNIVLLTPIVGYVVWSLLSYKKNETKVIAKSDIDSSILEQNKRLTDSILHPENYRYDTAFVAQQEKIAFGNLKFGMTKKEVAKLPEKERETFQKIGDYYYEIFPYYDYGGRLFKLEIQTFPLNANYIDTEVKQAHDNLVETIMKKYGDGDTLNAYPNILRLNSGFITLTRRWTIGRKVIELGVAEVGRGAEFYCGGSVYDKVLLEAEEKHKENQSDTLKKNDASKF